MIALPLVPCNIGEINQVVLNLIVNGAHAIRDRFEDGQKGILIVKSQFYKDAKCVIVSIADNGGGIPEKVRTVFSNLFLQRSWSGDWAGLAIAHMLSLSHTRGNYGSIPKTVTEQSFTLNCRWNKIRPVKCSGCEAIFLSLPPFL